jgi:hypothetical protein
MPRGNPKLPIMLRITRELRDAVTAYGVPFTKAVEEGLDLWLARAKRRQTKADPVAQPPPSPRERAVRGGRTA